MRTLIELLIEIELVPRIKNKLIKIRTFNKMQMWKIMVKTTELKYVKLAILSRKLISIRLVAKTNNWTNLAILCRILFSIILIKIMLIAMMIKSRRLAAKIKKQSTKTARFNKVPLWITMEIIMILLSINKPLWINRRPLMINLRKNPKRMMIILKNTRGQDNIGPDTIKNTIKNTIDLDVIENRIELSVRLLSNLF